jgi:hypothetical protein
LFDLREDPFERAQHEAGGYERWFIDRVFLLAPAQAIVGRYIQSFKDFPPRQKPGTFSVEQALERLHSGSTSNN